MRFFVWIDLNKQTAEKRAKILNTENSFDYIKELSMKGL